MRVASWMVALSILAGCQNGALDCFDGGSLEAAYLDGEHAAEAANAVNYDLGKRDGMALTRSDGEREGATEGYAAGRTAGYNGPSGYAAGYAEGATAGQADGLADPSACASGASAGHGD